MRAVWKRLFVLLTAVAMICASAVQTAALDNRFRFDELKMTVSVPKEFSVITRASDSADEVFEKLQLGYDETMIAFRNSDIYLRAYDPDLKYWVSMIVSVTDESKTINNYEDITAADRKGIAESLRSEASIDNAVEVKHHNIIFFDCTGKITEEESVLYIAQSNTVVNGMQIDLILQKADSEILPAETKVLTNMANSLEFDKITRSTGPIFEWWRLLLWVAILAGLAIALSLLYRRRNAASRRKLQERRHKRAQALTDQPEETQSDGEGMSFDEALGYQDNEQFTNRAATDLETYDIKVGEQDPKSGISYFEDSGESIDDNVDYFDTFFNEQAQTRKGAARFFGAVWTYIKIVFRHTGFFFVNLKNKIFRRQK